MVIDTYKDLVKQNMQLLVFLQQGQQINVIHNSLIKE